LKCLSIHILENLKFLHQIHKLAFAIARIILRIDANRLTSISGGQSATYAYNGLGDRLSQNGVTYTLDLNTGLTQVLNDGTNQYIYGVGRISQVNTSTEYFLGDALGSVRQLTDANGDITLANAYDPYGTLAQTAGSAQTSYGFTGEFTDPGGMVYLRARYYMPTDGRFLTRDTWMGDYNNPLSLNRWMYVNGNPINRIDPSGNVPCYMLPPDDQVNCIAVPPPPDWWTERLQLYIEGYGYIDPGHIRRGWLYGRWFIEQVEAALAIAHSYNLSNLGLPILIPLNRAKSDDRYWVDYAVSSNIDKEDKEEVYGIAYGMFMDFERGYEEYQNSLLLERVSGFAPADLPSDHLGFWAYMSGYERDEIPTLLQCLGELQVLPLQLPGGFIVDSDGIPENHEFLPMIGEVTDLGGFRQRNIAWPAFLEIQPIPRGPNTWRVLNRSFP